MAPIRVSRSGLTECPSCHAHMEVAAQVRDSVCPFCGTALVRAPDAADRGLRRLAGLSGRSGLLAATLLGALAVTACEDSGDPTGASADASKPDGGGLSDGSDAGTTPDATTTDAQASTDDAATTTDTTVSPDLPVALYGLPPEDAFVPPDAAATDDAHQDDLQIAPMYGLPADVDQPPADAQNSDDIAVVPMYGMPADVQEQGPDVQEAPDSVPQPKYGGPPADAW